MYFQPKNLKSERNNPWFNILPQKIRSVFRVLGIYNFARTPNWVFYPECWAATTQYKKNKNVSLKHKEWHIQLNPTPIFYQCNAICILWLKERAKEEKLVLILAKNQRCLYSNHWNSIKGFQHFEKFWLLRKDDIRNRLKFFGTTVEELFGRPKIVP